MRNGAGSIMLWDEEAGWSQTQNDSGTKPPEDPNKKSMPHFLDFYIH